LALLSQVALGLYGQFEPLEEALSALGLVVWPTIEFDAERPGWPRRSTSSVSARCCSGRWPRCARTRRSAPTWTRSGGPDRAGTSRPGRSGSARRLAGARH